jgi:NADH dehydrogenase [ubiquinone] 1 alpha subcomplex assembly factor 7
LASALGARFAREAGAALFIDYGHFPSAPGATLRAVSRHQTVFPLAAPGMADLSADVDFDAFAAAAGATGANTYGPVAQAAFLGALGVELRLARLVAGATSAQRQELERGVGRLLDSNAMGERFKVLALLSPGLPTPAGFDTAGKR